MDPRNLGTQDEIKAEYCEGLCFISGTQKSRPTLPTVGCWCGGGQGVTAESRGWREEEMRTAAAVGHLTCHLEMDRVDTITAAQYSLDGFGFQNLNYRDREKI